MTAVPLSLLRLKMGQQIGEVAYSMIKLAVAVAAYGSMTNENREPTTVEILEEIDQMQRLRHDLVHSGHAQGLRRSIYEEVIKPTLEQKEQTR